MTANEARDYLEVASQTATGQQALTQIGASIVIDDPRGGDDASSIAVATMVADTISRQYLSR